MLPVSESTAKSSITVLPFRPSSGLLVPSAKMPARMLATRCANVRLEARPGRLERALRNAVEGDRDTGAAAGEQDAVARGCPADPQVDPLEFDRLDDN